jgi:hypothetical protein
LFKEWNAAEWWPAWLTSESALLADPVSRLVANALLHCINGFVVRLRLLRRAKIEGHRFAIKLDAG